MDIVNLRTVCKNVYRTHMNGISQYETFVFADGAQKLHEKQLH